MQNAPSGVKAPRIVILGAGFAGLNVARRLRKTGADVTLIDQYNFHQFQPLFYQVATGRLEPSAISFPLRKIFQRSRNVHVRIARVESIDTAARQVITTGCTFPYDYLVIATGCSTNYFGNKNLEEHAFGMKSTPEAMALRNRILLNFEDALDCRDEEVADYMNIVIAGGGPTGAELAGSLIEMKKNVLPKDYPDMDFSKLQVYLVEGGPTTLGAMSEKSQQDSMRYLTDMGVTIWTNSYISDYDGRVVSLKDGRTIATRCMIWSAGIMGNVPPGIPKESVVRGNRIQVDETSRVAGLDGVFAIGDVSWMPQPDWPQGHPQLANVANHQGRQLAQNLRALMRGEATKPFRYKNPGTMATIGKRKAVVDLPKAHFRGVFAWLIWMFLHLMLILSIKNRLIIFINWAFSYFTNDTTLRLILLPTKKQLKMVKDTAS